MEKLQPVIRQIFWVLFGLGLILILWGWYAANSSLSADIEKEKARVQTTKTGAKKNVMGTPNSDWTEKAEDLNEKHKNAFDESAKKLWEQQLDARVYPELIRKQINQLPFRSKITSQPLRGIFRTLYNGYFLEQLEVIKPFKPETGLGLVDVANAQITRENPVKWKNRLPTSQEIWNTQEDIWLVRSILDAIAETNGAADRIDKAPIRSLLQLQLRGGDPEAEVGGAAAAGGMMGGGEMGGFGGMGGGMGEGSLGMGGSGLGGGGAAGGAWSQFKGSLTTDLLTEEFGPAPGAAASGMLGGMMGGEDDYGGGGGYGAGGGYGGGEATSGVTEEADSTADRYVHYGEELPYKTRAFILKVRMVQKDIPRLLASLPNGKFPVEIVRVDVDFSGGNSSVSGGGMSGMMGGEGGYGGGGGGDEYGGGMTGGFGGGGGMGMGIGLGGPGLGGPGLGGSGMGGAGLGGGFGGTAGKSKPKNRKERRMASDGMKIFAMAMSDPLATVRVAGLMTIYESPEEKAADAEAEDAAQEEANDSAEGLPPIDLNPEGLGGGLPNTDPAAEGTKADGSQTSPTGGQTGGDSELDSGSSTDPAGMNPADSQLGQPMDQKDGSAGDDSTADDSTADGAAMDNATKNGAEGGMPDDGNQASRLLKVDRKVAAFCCRYAVMA